MSSEEYRTGTGDAAAEGITNGGGTGGSFATTDGEVPGTTGTGLSDSGKLVPKTEGTIYAFVTNRPFKPFSLTRGSNEHDRFNKNHIESVSERALLRSRHCSVPATPYAELI